jgi:transcriptional regulator with XRE-family HTH domain
LSFGRFHVNYGVVKRKRKPKREPVSLVRAIHERIRELRKSNGLTQVELAAAVGIGKSAVCHWERGVSMPGGRHLDAVAVALGVTVAELFMPSDRRAA